MTRFNFTIQDASPFIAYTGQWSPGDPKQDAAAPEYDGSFTVTKDSDAKATFDFIGTGVSIFGAFRENHGQYSVKLDQLKNPSSTDGGGRDQYKVPLWTSYGLPYGKHTVEVTNEPVGGRPYFDVDFISIEREIGQDGNEILNSTIDDTAPTVQYHGSWVMDTTLESQNHNLTLHSTTTPNSEVEITFQGCCIEVYGLYTNAGYSVSLDKQPPTNMQGLDFKLDLPGDAWHPQTLLYLMDGLPEDTHTVSLTATKTNQQRPFSFDYAVARSASNTTDTASTHSGNSGLSQSAQIGLAVALSLGGIVLFGLIIAVFLIRRRRRRHPPPRMDLTAATAKLEPYEIVHDPPWMSLGRRRAAGPRSDTTFQFTSVISGWSPMSVLDERTETDERRASTRWGSSSATQSSQRGSIPPPPPPRTVTRPRKSDVMRGYASTSRARESTQTANGFPSIRAIMDSQSST